MDATKSKIFKACCAEYIREIWAFSGPDVLRWTGNCPGCGQFIGLTGTTRAEANNFLRSHGLKPLPIAREEIQREQKEIADWFEENRDTETGEELKVLFFWFFIVVVGAALAIVAFVKLLMSVI